MTESNLPQELEEQAAAYALGVLPPEDRSVFEKRLALAKDTLGETTKTFQSVAEQLAFCVQPMAPRASLRERVLAYLAREADRETASFESIMTDLAFTVAPIDPPVSLRTRLLDRLQKTPQLSRPAKDPLTFVKASEGRWQEAAPGVMVKVLFFDPVSRRATALVRMAPGTSYAPHRHTEAEELYVLEGGCFCGGRELTAGDYHRAAAGTEHHDTSSDEGCLLLVISSPQNEMLD